MAQHQEKAGAEEVKGDASCLDDVLASTAHVLAQLSPDDRTTHVTLDARALHKDFISQFTALREKYIPSSWAGDYHYCDGTDLTAQYIFVLDALNFCFWPLPDYEYHHLAGSLKKVLTNDKAAFSADNLATMTAQKLSDWLLCTYEPASAHGHPAQSSEEKKPTVIPLLDTRVRHLRELGRQLAAHFDGKAANVVRAAKHKAANLVALITANFPAFRDETVFRGSQVFLYKRAQILVGDIWGAFEGKGLGAFDDINKLTCFADYRIPQLLHSHGVLKYSEALEQKVLAKEQLVSGSEEEVQIRAYTVQVVEQLRQALAKLPQDDKQQQQQPNAVQLDWLLWNMGEVGLRTLQPHHRVLTPFY